MTRPHESLDLPAPLVRRLGQHASLLWMVLLWALICGVGIAYVGTMMSSSARGFQLRDAERRLERLQSEARTLEMDVAKASSVDAMMARATEMGFVAVRGVEALETDHSYAFAR